MSQPQVDTRFQLKTKVVDNRRRPVRFDLASSVNIIVKDPQGNLTTLPATKTNGGQDGAVDVYLTPGVVGMWQFQVVWITSGVYGRSHIGQFGVLENL